MNFIIKLSILAIAVFAVDPAPGSVTHTVIPVDTTKPVKPAANDKPKKPVHQVGH